MLKFKSKPITNHDELPVEDNNHVKDVEKFYNHEFQKPPVTQSRTLVLSLITAVFFGFVAGLLSLLLFLSGALSHSKLFSWLDINSLLPTANVIIERQEKTTVLEDERIETVLEKVSPVVVGVFNYQIPTHEKQKDIYRIENFLGSGLILTNDGWLITTREVVKTDGQYVVVTQSHEIYPVKQIERDGSLGLIFLKIEAKNLPVVSLASFQTVSEGEKVMVLTGLANFNKNLRMERVASHNFSLANKLIQESETYYLFISLAQSLDKKFLGAPVFNLNREVIGLNANEGETNYLIPADYIRKSFHQLLNEKKIKRIYLGLEYIDLSQVISSDLNHQGALITNIKKDSPLKKLDVQVEDIILKVDEDVVNGRKNLTNLIQSYEAGDKVKLIVLKKDNGKEVAVEVELK